MKDASISMYLRDNQVLVVPSAGNELDHVLIVEPVDSEVQRAFEEALQFAYSSPVVTDYDPKKWPVLKALGLKSARAFYQNVANATVLIYEGKIQVLPRKPTKKGQAFEGDGPWIPVEDIKSVGSIALKTLNESPRMNPKQ